MRGWRSTRYYPRFPEAVPVRGAGCPRVTQPFATLYTPEGALTVRLACVRRAASVHPEPGSNSPSKYVGPRARPVLSVIADRFRSIHMVLLDRKRNFSGPPLGGLAKNKSKLDHFKWFDVCPDATLEVSILAVSGSQGARFAADPVPPGRAARRYIARPEGPRGRESGCTHFLHI